MTRDGGMQSTPSSSLIEGRYGEGLVTPPNTMSDALLLACSLSTWGGDKKRCRWCDKDLAGRQRRWCSDTCANDASCNHWFNSARHRATQRDEQKCVRCGTPECEVGEDGRPRVVQLEVHHRDERADGRHGQCSCAHHLDGLETLCRPCHLAEHAAKPKPDQLRLEAA